MIYHTFKKWSQMGYSIIKDSKSNQRNKNNEPLFSEGQVKKSLNSNKYEGIDYSQDAEFWAKANPNALYWYLVDNPEKRSNISDKAGAILAKNMY